MIMSKFNKKDIVSIWWLTESKQVERHPITERFNTTRMSVFPKLYLENKMRIVKIFLKNKLGVYVTWLTKY